jgi:hypothetical protein
LYVIVDKPRLVSDLQEFLRELGFVAAHPHGRVSTCPSPDRRIRPRRGGSSTSIWRSGKRFILVPTRPLPNATREACRRRPRAAERPSGLGRRCT